MMADNSISLIAGASTEELEHAKECLMGWRCEAVDVNDEMNEFSFSGRIELIVLYARKAEKDTLAICEQLRDAPQTADTPLLLVISRYLIFQTHAVKQMGNTEFIIAPFDKKEMCDKIAECFGI